MISVVCGVLADQEAEGIVRPMRSDLAPVSTAGRDLVQRAGDVMDRKLEQIGVVPVGGAVLTPSGELSTDFVIHAVVSAPDEPESTVTVQKALKNALARAADWELESLALPPLGMGAGMMDATEPARTMLEILFNHLAEGKKPLDLRIVVESEYEEDVFTRLIERMAEDHLGGNP